MVDYGRLRCSIGISVQHLESMEKVVWENTVATNIRNLLTDILETPPSVVAECNGSDDEFVEFSIGISNISTADHETIRACLTEAGIEVSNYEGDLIEDYNDGEEWTRDDNDANKDPLQTFKKKEDDGFFAS